MQLTLASTTGVAYCARKGFHLWTWIEPPTSTHVASVVPSVSQTSLRTSAVAAAAVPSAAVPSPSV